MAGFRAAHGSRSEGRRVGRRSTGQHHRRREFVLGLLEAGGLIPVADDPAGGGVQIANADLLRELLGSPVPLSQRRCETSTGIQLHPHDVLRAALAGHVRRVVVDSAGVVIDLGRRQRLFTGAAREAAKLLLLRCDHPGCELAAEWCDVDHAIEWVDGGTNDQSNSGFECRPHNVAKTKRRWRTRRADDGRRYVIRSDGSIMLPVGVRPPTFSNQPAGGDQERWVGSFGTSQLMKLDGLRVWM